MENDLASNPFAQLFTSLEVASQFSSHVSFPPQNVEGPPFMPSPCQAPSPQKLEEEKFIGEVLAVTLIKDCPLSDHCHIYMGDVLSHLKHLEVENLDEVIYERLTLEDPHLLMVGKPNDDDKHCLEKDALFYLFLCFTKTENNKYKIPYDIRDKVTKTIMTQAANIMYNPEILLENKPLKNFADLYLEYQNNLKMKEHLSMFLMALVEHAPLEDETISSDTTSLSKVLLKMFETTFQAISSLASNLTLMDPQLYPVVELVQHFTLHPALGLAFLEANSVVPPLLPSNFQKTILGKLLALSCLPSISHNTFDYFDKPFGLNFQKDSMQDLIWEKMTDIVTFMHTLFKSLLRLCPETKEKLILWIKTCLFVFRERSKLWNTLAPSVNSADGFLLMLESVLLKLCEPFNAPHSPKLLKISPHFFAACITTNALGAASGEVPKETCLIPNEERENNNNNLPCAPQPSFIAELFFLTHKALQIGFQVCQDTFVKMNQELTRLQKMFEEAAQQFSNEPFVQDLKTTIEKKLTTFLSYKSALQHPEKIDNMLLFHITTSSWLTNYGVLPPEIGLTSTVTEFHPVTFPLSPSVSPLLAYIPEFLVENCVDCCIFLKRYNPKVLEQAGPHLNHLFTLILVFMGSPQRMFNPHLRARLAMMLEALLPNFADGAENFSRIHLQRLFTDHPLVKELVPVLLHVFVSIETTGQSVSFEQKFQYRSPMYLVLKYIWDITVHRNTMKDLARVAEENIESPDPPIFLRFINLLINDANFLLDEALSCMIRLREFQEQRRSGGSLSAEDQASYQQTGLLARFHNVMSNESISTLQWLTAEIRSIFCHPAIVDRITAMLNYFLLHLVGPEKKKLRVKDFEEYEFKPKQLLKDICEIYIHLGLTEEGCTPAEQAAAEAFCRAVSRDGRSYSPSLFAQASRILPKVFAAAQAMQIDELSIKVQKLAITQSQEEEMLGDDIPEEFLDPIINTVMKDPVILPSSGVRTDRSTIARHLLSDQTDPFNRSPLTMDQVKPDVELKARIQEWLAQKSASSGGETSNSPS